MAFADLGAFLHQQLPDVAADFGADQVSVHFTDVCFAAHQRGLHCGVLVLPAGHFLAEGHITAGIEVGNFLLVVFQELAVLGQPKGLFADLHLQVAMAEGVAHFGEFFLAHRVVANLVEKLQQPGLATVELAVLQMLIPDRQGAPHQLVTAGGIHAVDAHVNAADAHGAFGGIGARRVVLGGHQTVARINGHCAGRTQIHITQTQHQIAGAENDVAYLIRGLQAVDATNELHVAGQPGRVGANGFLVTGDRIKGGAVFECHGQMQHPGGDHHFVHTADAFFTIQQGLDQGGLIYSS